MPAANSDSASEGIRLEAVGKACSLLRQAMLKVEHCCRQLTAGQIWTRPSPGMNSVGNLLLHVDGNLRQWALSGLGGQPDSRDRQAEFSAEVSTGAEVLLERLRQTVDEATSLFARLDHDALTRTYQIQGFECSGLAAMFHTSSHLVGHTHQIIQLTRLQLGANYEFHWTPACPRGEIPI